MHRRDLLGAVGVVLLAGCNSAADDEPADQSTTTRQPTTESRTTGQPTPESTPRPTTPAPAAFEVTTDAGGRALADRTWRLTFAVRNTGGQTGEFDTTLQRRSAGGSWTDLERFGAALEPGQQRRFEGSIPAPDAEEATYRLSGTNQSWTIEFVEPATYEMIVRSVPDRIEIGEALPVTVEITNIGGVEMERRVSIGAGMPDSSIPGDSREFTVSLPPGESVTRTAELGPWSYLGTLRLYTDDGPTDVTVDVGRARLAVGEVYTTPTEVETTVADLELTDSYTYEQDGQTRTRTAPEGSHFAIATIRSANTTSELRDAPAGFALYGPSGRYESGDYEPAPDEYEGGQLLDGATRSGRRLWTVPTSVQRSDLRIVWAEETQGGGLAVSWTPE